MLRVVTRKQYKTSHKFYKNMTQFKYSVKTVTVALRVKLRADYIRGMPANIQLPPATQKPNNIV